MKYRGASRTTVSVGRFTFTADHETDLAEFEISPSEVRYLAQAVNRGLIAPMDDEATQVVGLSTRTPASLSMSGGSSGIDSEELEERLLGLGVASEVKITGLPQVGAILTAQLPAGWGAEAFQWTRDGADIAGATSASYTVQVADAGTALTCKASGLYTLSDVVSIAVPDAGGEGGGEGGGGEVETPPVVIAPLTGITEVWFAGASLEDGIFGASSAFQSVMQKYLKSVHNLDLIVLDKAVGGENLDDIVARWNTEKRAITGRADVIVNTMPLGNTISGSGQWSLLSLASQDFIKQKLASYLQSILDNGNVPLPVNTTFRNYGSDTVNLEEKGSLPYNEAVLYPPTQALSPSMWYDGKPWTDPYDLVRNAYSEIMSDEVHLTPNGYHLLRTFELDCLAARIKGEAPPRITRVADPTVVPTRTAAQVLLAAGSHYNYVSTALWGASALAESTVGRKLIPRRDYKPCSIVMICPAITAGSLTSIGDNSGDLTDALARSNFILTESRVYTRLALLSGFAPNQWVTFKIMACVYSPGKFITEFSADNGVSSAQLDAATPEGAGHIAVELNAQADGTGQIELKWRTRLGRYGYVNAVLVTPHAGAAPTLVPETPISAPAPGFSPASLFSGGDNGAFYDSFDVSTMFQEALGYRNATTGGHPVALRLDKRIADSYVTPAVEDGYIAASSTAATLAGVGQGYGTTAWFPVEAGASYEIRPIGGDSTKKRMQVKDSGGVVTFLEPTMTSTAAEGVFAIPAGAVECRIYFKANTDTAVGLSVRKVAGNHAKQTTTTMRPLLQDGPRRLVYDGTDDALVTTFAAALGSNCTVARAIPGTGAQILTGQTIDTTFTDNVSNCALVIINRALTGGETTSLTAWLNQRAGL